MVIEYFADVTEKPGRGLPFHFLVEPGAEKKRRRSLKELLARNSLARTHKGVSFGVDSKS